MALGLLFQRALAVSRRIRPNALYDWLIAASAIFDSLSPVAIASFAYPTPTVLELATNVPGVTAATFTIVHNGTGDVSVTWPASTFRTSTAQPFATNVGATPGSATAEKIANGVRVRSLNAAGAAADLNFQLVIFGQ